MRLSIHRLGTFHERKIQYICPHLKDEEYITWHGRALSFDHLKLKRQGDESLFRYLLKRAFYAVLHHIKRILIITVVLIPIIGFAYFLGLFDPEGAAAILIGIVYLAFILLGIFVTIWEKVSGKALIIFYTDNTTPYSADKMPYQPWKDYRYAITNERVLILEDDRLKAYSLLLLKDNTIQKPENGVTSISLFSELTIGEKHIKPVATLYNLSEDDATTAYELLTQARDISFEDRIEKLGLE